MSFIVQVFDFWKVNHQIRKPTQNDLIVHFNPPTVFMARKNAPRENILWHFPTFRQRIHILVTFILETQVIHQSSKLVRQDLILWDSHEDTGRFVTSRCCSYKSFNEKNITIGYSSKFRNFIIVHHETSLTTLDIRLPQPNGSLA